MKHFNGIAIEVSKYMTGFKRAIRFGDGPLIVSPAMYDLISHANEDELRLLLDNIHVQKMPDMKVDFSLPMTTSWRKT